MKIPSGGGTTCVETPVELDDTCKIFVEAVEDTFHLGLGVVYNVSTRVLCVATPEGIGEVYNVLEEVSGVGQRFTNFRHSERSEESQVTLLRGAKRRGNPGKLIKNWITSLTTFARNDRKSYPLPYKMRESYPLYLWEREEFQCEFYEH